MRGHHRSQTGRQRDDLVTRPHRAGGDPARVTAIVGQVVGARTDHVLHREPQRPVGGIVGQVDALQVLENARPVYQSIRSDRVTTLSPCSAEIGIAVTSWMPSSLA